MKNKKRLVPWLIAAVIIAALAVIGKKLYDLMFGGSLAVTTEDLKNGIIACSPAIIFIVVVLIAALIVVVAAGKLKQPKRALVRAQAPIAILLAITLSVNWVILGVEYSVVNSVFAEDVKVSDETMASGRAIADQIASEGIVLLKNDDKALPLSAGTKLNLFGWSSVRPLYGGTGSGDSDTSNAVSLIDGLKHAGFEVNEELVKFYENFRTERPVGTIRLREIGSKRGDFTVPEPTIAEYENANIFEDAVAYSDTAVVVVSRTGGEGFDIPQSITGPDEYNAQYGGLAQFYDFTTQAEDLDASKSYLELSNREIAMVDRVCKEFKNVIVVVNSSNAMELGWLDQYDSIKAAVLCGAPGELGFDSLGKILSGEVNPSGHLADTYVYDLLATPTANNFGGFAYDNYAEVTGSQDNRAMFVNYCEGIYVGYRYYETRYEDKVLGQGNAGDYNYDDAVMYPFGYGLSYTTFDWSDYNTSWDGDTCTVTVKVTNTGSVAGKDVVEVYAQSPYTDYDKTNKVEKAAVELVGYAKTSELAPGASETVTVTFDQEQLKSYDYTNAKTYILDAGDYYITAAKNAHEAVNNILSAKGKTVADGMTADGDTAFVATYTPANGTVDTTTYKNDTTTGVEVTNQLDQANGGFQYLSRNDWTGTWPTTDGEVSDQISTWGNPINGTDANGNPASYTYYKTISSEDLAKLDSFDSLNTTDPSTLTDELVYGKDNGLGLIDMRGLDYNDPKWNDLLDQLTPGDYQTLITQSGYGTAAIKSVDKLSTTDRDAATGLVNYGVDASGNFYFKGNITHCGVIVLAQTYNDDLATHYGENIGDESYYLDVDGWYAPAVNMHRTAFSGRNSEYYSEDPFIGGHIASLECEGVASRGMYVFVKHYAINDQEDHRGDREGQYSIATFLNEQAAREIYLKPFEMCVKSDKVEMNYAKDNGDGTYSNATTEIPSVTGIMTSFNRVGYTWAGGNYNMITGLLRNEWGFHGFIITDNANTGVFMDAGQMIQAGADGKLTNLPTGARYTFNKNDVSDYHYGREAVHNILYTIANSKAMNGGMPGSRYLAKVEPYQKVIYAVDGVCGGLIAVLVILTIFRFRKKKEDNIKTV